MAGLEFRERHTSLPGGVNHAVHNALDRGSSRSVITRMPHFTVTTKQLADRLGNLLNLRLILLNDLLGIMA